MRYIVFFLSVYCSSFIYGQNLKSGGKLSPDQAIMDIRHYTVSLTVDPDQKSINGYTEIDLILSAPTERLVFDLTNVLQVNKVWVNGKDAKQDHVDHKLIITSAAGFNPGRIKAKIAYSGKRANCTTRPWAGAFRQA